MLDITFNKKKYLNTTKINNDGQYIGEIKNDIREGKGKMYFKNGDRYEGEWKNDKERKRNILF